MTLHRKRGRPTGSSPHREEEHRELLPKGDVHTGSILQRKGAQNEDLS